MKKEHRERLAEFVTEWMESRELSERAAADLLDVSQTAVSSWKNGRTGMKLEYFIRFAELTGKTPEGLLAQVRGVVLKDLPRELTYQDIWRIVRELDTNRKRDLMIDLTKDAKWDD
jgi:transcriptional regulator with XRE-family HTH domain